MVNVDPKTLDLIAKLHSLATNKGATEAEASNALAKMQALLFKHNLSISDVRLTSEDKTSNITEDSLSTHEIVQKWFGSRIRKNEREWTVILASYVTRYNFCDYLAASDFSRVFFVGTAENVQAVKEIWLYAIEQVMDLADESYKAYKRRGGYVYYRIYRRNFANGCVLRLGQRLYEEWRRLQQENVGSTALIVVNQKALKEYVEEKATGTFKTTNPKQQAGVGAGFAAGDLVELGAKKKQLA